MALSTRNPDEERRRHQAEPDGPSPPADLGTKTIMPCNLITAATFRQLQSRLLEDLRRAIRADGLAPKWVVVPSATLANHLRTELSRGAQSEVFANVRVVNLPRFAQRLAMSLSQITAPPWNALLDLLLWDIVEDLPPKSPLAPLKTISGPFFVLKFTAQEKVYADIHQIS